MNALVGVGGLVAATFAVVFAGWQTRQSVAQTRLSNKIAAAQEGRAALTHLAAVLRIFIDHPELRAYVYDGAQVPIAPSPRAQVATLAELLADCLDINIQAGRVLRRFGEENAGDWKAYASLVAKSSPALVKAVEDHGASWWPDLHRALTTTPDVRG